jgi:quercetin dioxygenase-like cupin family protein
VRAEPVRRDGATLWPLTRRSPAGLHVYRAVISAKRNRPPAERRVHGGHDWLFVLSGRMRLVLSDHEHVIEPGEAVEFSTWTPHWFGAVDGPVELIMIIGDEGEQAHLQ